MRHYFHIFIPKIVGRQIAPHRGLAYIRNLNSRGHSKGELWHRHSYLAGPPRIMIGSRFLSGKDVYNPWTTTGMEADPASSGLGETLPPGYLAPPPSPADPMELAEKLTSIGEPTLSSLGLGGPWPSGWIQSLLESIHVTVDIPWAGSVVLLTLVIRCLMLPLTVMQLKNAALMSQHMPVLMNFQQQQMEASLAKDAAKVEKLRQEAEGYMQRNSCSPLAMITKPMIAAPVFVSVFYGIKGMTNLPVQSLTTGGAFWFMDLTVPDPFYIIPAIAAFTVYAVTMTGAEGTSVHSLSPGMQMFFKVMPIGIFAFISFQPAALALYWSTSNILSLIFSKIFRTTAIRNYFNIPEMMTHPPPKMFNQSGYNQSTDGTMTEYYRLQLLKHELEDRQKVEQALEREKMNNMDSSSPTITSTSMNMNKRNNEIYDHTKPRLSKQQFKESPIDTTSEELREKKKS